MLGHRRLVDIGIAPPSPDWDIATSKAFVRREDDLWTKYIKVAKIGPQ